jgi:hypothetical protein
MCGGWGMCGEVVVPDNVLVVNGEVMLTPIAVRAVTEAMRGQFKAHLRRLDLKIGLLANFQGESLEIETIRVG